MQGTIVQREPADVLPVDASIATSNPIPCGAVVAILASGNLVYGGTASSTVIGVASADQDPDENTCEFWIIKFASNKSFGRVIPVKLSIACNAYADLWLDPTNGFATPTEPGSGPIYLGVSKNAGVQFALVDLVA